MPPMPLKFFAKKEEIPEAQRETAIELKDGRFTVEEPVDTTTLESTLAKERADRKEEEKARKAAEKERDELKRTQAAREKGISDEELQRIRDDEAKARKPIEDERDRLRKENDQLKRTDKVRTLALAKGIMPDRIEDAMLLLDTRTELTDAGAVAVKDKAGKITAETLDDFLGKTFKAEKPWLYKGSGASGSGATGSTAEEEEEGEIELVPAAAKATDISRRERIASNF
jgi:hypothetical protein